MSASEFPHASEACERIQSHSWVGVMALTCCGIVFCFKGGYVCILGCLSVVYESGFGGDPYQQCPERIGFQYGGQLGKHMYLLVAKGLVAFGIICYLGTLETIFCNPSVHGAHEVGYLSMFASLLPLSLCDSGPLQHSSVGEL